MAVGFLSLLGSTDQPRSAATVGAARALGGTQACHWAAEFFQNLAAFEESLTAGCASVVGDIFCSSATPHEHTCAWVHVPFLGPWSVYAATSAGYHSSASSRPCRDHRNFFKQECKDLKWSYQAELGWLTAASTLQSLLHPGQAACNLVYPGC